MQRMYNSNWNDADNSGSIADFTSTLEKMGYIVQEGRLQYLDVLKLCSLGIIEDCFGNHAGAPYASYMLPPSPNQEPSKGQRPPKVYDPAKPHNYPPNKDYLGPGTYFKLRPSTYHSKFHIKKKDRQTDVCLFDVYNSV